eukprot:gene12467-6217_t
MKKSGEETGNTSKSFKLRKRSKSPELFKTPATVGLGILDTTEESLHVVGSQTRMKQRVIEKYNSKRRSMSSIKDTTENSLLAVKSFFNPRNSPKSSKANSRITSPDLSDADSAESANRKRKSLMSVRSLFGGSATPKSPHLSEKSSDSSHVLMQFDDTVIRDVKLPSLEELSEKFPFEFCINDQMCSEYFKKCLEKLFCCENFNFYRAAKEFENEQDKERRHELAQQIISVYFKIGSSNELNIKDDVKKNCEKECEELLELQREIPKNFFQETLKKVSVMLQIEEYSKFLTSEEFKNFYQKKMEQEEDPENFDEIDVTSVEEYVEDED